MSWEDKALEVLSKAPINGGWVYTQDALPEQGELVLVSYGHRGSLQDIVTCPSAAYQYEGDGMFSMVDTYTGYSQPVVSAEKTVEQGGLVYAWMPWPDPAPEVSDE